MLRNNSLRLSPDSFLEGELITLKQAAEQSGLSESYLRAIAQSGRLVARKIDREWRTSLQALEEYKKTRTHVIKKQA
ncbi:MAG TPA: helix-turn-helix domain-containing protein [Chloroflexia bacterium]|nr:helix-turn-helix domain-containing protein [Chloroflexia bacterium]